jgi:hypothetical protein
MPGGLIVVFEGQRILLRVFRRYLYPLRHTFDGREVVVYSDTGREVEINYNSAEDFDLDDPFKRMALIRLARAMGCLRWGETVDGARECRVTVCRSEELHGFPSEGTTWVPFDPERLEPLEERLERLRSRVEWSERLNGP